MPPSLWQRTRAAYSAFRQPFLGDPVSSVALPDNHAERYALLRSYYESTAFGDVNRQAAARGVKGLKFLDNPAHQAVEFHAAHLFAGSLKQALPLTLEKNAALEDPIKQVFAWSNWASEKQVYARTLSCTGDAFIKAAMNESRSRAFLQLTDPEHVTDFLKDERGFLVYIRLDFPVEEEEAGQTRTHTEVWSKQDNAYEVWPFHSLGPGADFDALGQPETSGAITDFGIDFVPFVHAPFQDVGKDRGVGCFERFLEPIDEINRAVNRLHETFFKYGHPSVVLKRNEVGQGPANLQRDSPNDEGEADTVALGQTELYRLPGNASLEHLIANLPYEAGRNLINDRHLRLAESLAELRFYRDVEAGDPSGVARRVRLAPAVSRGTEARGNAEAALVRAIQMCLTLGARAGLFRGIGTYEAGSLDFSFEEREILPVSDEERFSSETREAEAYAAWSDLPAPLMRRYLEKKNFDNLIIEEIVGGLARRQTDPIQQFLASQTPLDPPAS